jgi:hypothetical protein
MTGVNLDHYGDALMRNPDTWVWLVVAVFGVAACLRVMAFFGADDWISFAVMLVMCWIVLGCLVDVALAGPIAGHLTDLWYWELAAFGAVWLVGGYWLVNRFLNWVQAQFPRTTPPR